MADSPRIVTYGDLVAPLEATELGRVLEAIRRRVADHSDRVYLVGGLIRDLLLGRESRDVDLAVAGEVEPVAEALAETLAAEVRHHSAFMTARLESAAGFVIDLARLRREEYPKPGALPRVAAGSLAEDLNRRDFTINAMAVELKRTTSRLIDLHDGRADLAAAKLRVLHPESFVDDPTRVLRGIRLLGRYGLEFDPRTRELAKQPATGRALAGVSGFRVWRELGYAFRDTVSAAHFIRELDALDLARAIHPALGCRPSLAEELAEVEELMGTERGRVEVLRVWMRDVGRSGRWGVAERLALNRRERLAIGVRPPKRLPAGRMRG